MKKSITLFTTILVLITTSVFAQTTMKEFKVGHIFNISLPAYMSKTIGLNAAAGIQFKNEEKAVYGIVIEDTKEDLLLAEAPYTSIDNFFKDFITDFVKGEEKRTESAPITKKAGTTNFVECDVSYYDKESNLEFYYFVGIVETPTSFYKVLCWTLLENKAAYKADFQKILYSLKD